MTDQEKEFESIDDLFRRSFDNLPASADPNGWDSPSTQVWAHVQSRIRAPKSGWSAQQLWMISAFAVAVTLALYWILAAAGDKSPQPAEMPPVQPVLEAPASPALSDDTAGIQPQKNDQPVKKARKTLPDRQPARFNSAKTPTSENKTALPLPDAPKRDAKPLLRPDASAPLPGSDLDYHNSTERERAERAKKPLLQILPAYRKETDPPSPPAFLQKLRKE